MDELPVRDRYVGVALLLVVQSVFWFGNDLHWVGYMAMAVAGLFLWLAYKSPNP